MFRLSLRIVEPLPLESADAVYAVLSAARKICAFLDFCLAEIDVTGAILDFELI